MILVSLLLILFFTFYLLLKRKYAYWKKRGVPGPEPHFIVGNVGSAFLMKQSVNDIVTELYNKYPNAALVGMFKGITPTLIVRDPDMIRDILIKDFGNFHDNDIDVDVTIDPLLGRNPFALKGEKWKIVRSLLTPCFTSGKMKSIFPLLEDMSRQFVKFTKQQSEKNRKSGVDVKELCKNYTLNTVASCAFGLDGRCFEIPNSEFRQIADKFLVPGGWTSMIFMLSVLIPSLIRICRVKMISKEVEDRLIAMTSETIRYRKENNIERNDFIQIVSKLKETSKDYEFTDVDVSAQAASFFVDGYETTATVMSFIMFNLANNPTVQDKLRTEIDENFEQNKGTLTYDSVQNMTYLDAAFCESLRIHPAGQIMFKRCTREYTYMPKPNCGIEKPVVIEVGTTVFLPTMGIQNDPKYFPNPDVYNPDRFLGKNKENMNKYVYMPFGIGPRACLGQRFAILQIKTAVAYIIRHFKLSVNKKTQQPLKFDPLYIMLAPIGGFWIDFEERKL